MKKTLKNKPQTEDVQNNSCIILFTMFSKDEGYYFLETGWIVLVGPVSMPVRPVSEKDYLLCWHCLETAPSTYLFSQKRILVLLVCLLLLYALIKSVVNSGQIIMPISLSSLI